MTGIDLSPNWLCRKWTLIPLGYSRNSNFTCVWFTCFIALIKQCCEEGRKEGNVLFNDALNTFYLRSYGVRNMVKDHGDSQIWNPLLILHGLLFSISSKGSFICTISHTGWHIPQPCSHGALAGTTAQWVHHEVLIQRPIAPWADALSRGHISLPNVRSH